jgi:hypothetical protein
LNLLRFHKNVESVERHKNKFPDKYEMMRIAELIVNNEYHKGNNRFFLYVDMDEEKVRGELNDEMIEYGLGSYINEDYNSLLKPYLVQKENGKKKHTSETAYQELKNRLKAQYFQ